MLVETEYRTDPKTGFKWVSVTDLLKRVTESMDCGSIDRPERLLGMMCYKLSDNNHVPAIIRAIEKEGFTVPICIQEMENGEWYLGNGHHRFVAAILMGLDEVLVDFSDSHSDASEDYKRDILLDARPYHNMVESHFLYDHIFDMLVDWVGTEQEAQHYVDCLVM